MLSAEVHIKNVRCNRLFENRLHFEKVEETKNNFCRYVLKEENNFWQNFLKRYENPDDINIENLIHTTQFDRYNPQINKYKQQNNKYARHNNKHKQRSY